MLSASRAPFISHVAVVLVLPAVIVVLLGSMAAQRGHVSSIV